MKKEEMYKKKIIKLLTYWVIEKYIMSIYHEEMYIHHFGKLELENKEKILEFLLLDFKLQKMYSLSHHIKDNQAVEIISDSLGHIEFDDLQQQINELKYKLKYNVENIDFINSFRDSKIYDKIENILSKTSYFVNDNPENIELGDKFFKSLKNTKLEKINDFNKRAKKLKDSTYNIDKKTYNMRIDQIEDLVKKLETSHPYNLWSYFENQDEINNKVSEIQQDIVKNKNAIDLVFRIYLQVSENNNGLLN